MTIYILVIIFTHIAPQVRSFETPQEACMAASMLDTSTTIYRASLDKDANLVVGTEYTCPDVKYPL